MSVTSACDESCIPIRNSVCVRSRVGLGGLFWNLGTAGTVRAKRRKPCAALSNSPAYCRKPPRGPCSTLFHGVRRRSWTPLGSFGQPPWLPTHPPSR